MMFSLSFLFMIMDQLAVTHDPFCCLQFVLTLHCTQNKHTFVHLCLDLFSSGHSSCNISALRKVGFIVLDIFTFYFYVLTSAYSVNGSCMTHSLHRHKLTSVLLWCALVEIALEDHPESRIYTNCEDPFNLRN